MAIAQNPMMPTHHYCAKVQVEVFGTGYQTKSTEGVNLFNRLRLLVPSMVQGEKKKRFFSEPQFLSKENNVIHVFDIISLGIKGTQGYFNSMM